MNCWIIINSFVNSAKFYEIYELLENSANEFGVKVEVKTSDQFTFDINNGYWGEDKPSFVIFWDKDIILAKRLENQGIKVFNSAFTIETCDNKILTAIELAKNNIKTPKTIAAPKTFDGLGYNSLNFLDKVETQLEYPFIIKEAYGSFGKQVYLVKNREEAISIINKVWSKPILFQDFIKESCGRDIRVNVVGGKVVASILRENDRDFRSNLTLGGVGKKAVLSKEEEEIAIKASRAVKGDFCGVDVLFGKDGPIICEVNSNPHFKTTLDCTGVDISKDIIGHILESIRC